MTITRIDGLGNLALDTTPTDNGWTYATGTRSIGGGKFGGNGYQLTTTQTLSSDRTLVNFKRMGTTWWWKPDDLIALGNIWTINHGVAAATMLTHTSTHMSLTVDTDGSLRLHTGGALRATSAAGLVVAGEWQHIEVRYSWGTSAGVAKVWLNGTLIFDFVGDTVFSNLDGAIHIGNACSTSGTIDDVVSVEDDHLPILSHQIHDLEVTGDGAKTDFTGDYTQVDDALGTHDGDATIAVGLEIGEEQDYTIGALPVNAETTTVHAVKVGSYCRKTDTPNKEISTVLTSGATETVSAQQIVQTDFTNISDLYLVDPDTAVAWVTTDVGDIKVGSKIIV